MGLIARAYHRTGQDSSSASVGDWYRFPGTERTDNVFRYAVWQMAERLDGDVNAYAAIMSLESGFRPDIKNPYADAVGLIQFMGPTARALGTTTAALRKMSALEQLPYVEKFYRKAVGVKDPGTLYMLTFLPAFANRDDSFVLGEQDSAEPLYGSTTKGKIYEQNWGFDDDKDGVFTVGDVKSKARGRYASAKAAGSIPIVPEEPGGFGTVIVSGIALGIAVGIFYSVVT